MTVTEAGVLANIGVNNKGVSVFLNYISVMETTYSGAVYHILLRRALESDNAFDLQNAIIRSPIAFSIHIMCCDKEHQPASYELTSTWIFIRRSESNSILHTNHILSDWLKCRKLRDKQYIEFTGRYNALKSKVSELVRRDRVSVDDVYDVLRSHDGDAPICRHFSNEEPYEMGTVFSMIVEYEDEADPKVYLSFGEPCSSEIQKNDMTELFDF